MEKIQKTPLVIAEISANHNGSLNRLLQIVKASHEAGASLVKFQHFKPDSLTVRSRRPEFFAQGGTLWDGASLYDLYSEAALPWEWTEQIVQFCQEMGVGWFSSVFDNAAIDFLEPMEPYAYKIASPEIVDLPLIRQAASTGRRLVISTGMASEVEIEQAVGAAREGGAASVTLLRCNSSYPASPSEMNLAVIPVIAERWGVEVGLSDHTMTSTSAIVATALGAVMIEKHVTLRRSDGGPDAGFSLEPQELRQLVLDVEEAASSVGEVKFGPAGREVATLAYRRSLRFVQALGPGEIITEGSVRSIRPAGGLMPDQVNKILGRRVVRNVEIGEPVTWSVIE